MLPNTDSSGASQVAEILRDSILQLAIPHARPPIYQYLSISLEICTVYGNKLLDNVEELIKSDDLTLYKSKNTDRNCYTCNTITYQTIRK